VAFPQVLLDPLPDPLPITAGEKWLYPCRALGNMPVPDGMPPAGVIASGREGTKIIPAKTWLADRGWVDLTMVCRFAGVNPDARERLMREGALPVLRVSGKFTMVPFDAFPTILERYASPERQEAWRATRPCTDWAKSIPMPPPPHSWPWRITRP
jgi:hypothetical protein